MSKLTMAEQFTLRAMTGRVVGEALANFYEVKGGLGIVTNKTFICASLVGAVEATFLSLRRGLAKISTAMMEKPEEAKEAVKLLKDMEMVMLGYGGELGGEENYALTKAFLKAAAEEGLTSDLFFHVRIWLPAFVQRAMEEDEKIASYLKGKKLGTFTFDLDRGVFLFYNVKVDEEGKVTLKLISEVPISLEHLDLLKRSL
ncbi:hypothetical protein [Caldanaerobacter sp.]|uniref:hypothetical protein n=1 Tax=Caldanaerobacter sp. TaxID=2930036 RepID=UPI003C7279F1